MALIGIRFKTNPNFNYHKTVEGLVYAKQQNNKHECYQQTSYRSRDGAC